MVAGKPSVFLANMRFLAGVSKKPVFDFNGPHELVFINSIKFEGLRETQVFANMFDSRMRTVGDNMRISY